ncbi:MAG: DUF2290 domain-containing protein [Dysgonamonadaceae bacterium]|jgi:hypothetical protein|nr:DUF2290 domain-containing protein [Dysgonamonadaceae bacterium]
MMTQKNFKKLNTNVENTLNEMNNSIRFLYENRIVYFFNVAGAEVLDRSKEKTMISWKNHISSRLNSGKSFTTLDQYKHILQNDSFHCILYDGSLIRSSFIFEKNKIINHSHLWWPSPYDYRVEFNENYTPIDAYDDFVTDSHWDSRIRMRSPVRIDFDPTSASDIHPAVHMHTQHHECRMRLDSPICFNRFIAYILFNYYPHLQIDLKGLNMLTFTYDRSKETNFSGTNISFV